MPYLSILYCWRFYRNGAHCRYGTVLYFYQFVNNHRYKSLQAWEVFGVVGVSNGIWIFFPMLGFYTSVRLIMDESFAVWQ